MKRRILPLVALAATVGFLALFIRQTPLGEVGGLLADLPPGALLVALAAVLVAVGFTALRWRTLLSAAGVDAPLSRLFAGLVVGSAANNVVPARGGDLVRVQAVRETTPVPAFAVVGTLVAERLLDGFVLSLWLLLGAAAVGAPQVLVLAGLALTAGSALGIALAVLAAASPERAERAVGRLAGLLPARLAGPAARAGSFFVSGLAVFRSRRHFAAALGASFALWLADVVLYGALARGFGLDIPLAGAFLLEGIGNLALAVPATAAGIGTFDYLTLVGAQSIGITGPAASAYVLAVHALVVLPVTLLGAALVWWALPGTFRALRLRRATQPPKGAPMLVNKKRAAFATALAAVVLGAGTASAGALRGPSGTVPQGPSGELTFVRGKDIYVARADGSGLRNLTRSPRGNQSSPAWSPDGRQLAFTSYRDGNGEIYVMKADGTGLRRVTRHRADDLTPTWSPDGRRIAFTSNRSGEYEVHVMNADGTGVRRLTRIARRGYGSGSPAWSPDGGLIAFTSSGPTPENNEIYTIRPDGTGLKRLTRTRGDAETPGDDGFPSWSPDGRTIVFSSHRRGFGDLWTMRRDGSNQRRLVGLPRRDDWWPRYSPDGAWIVFESLPRTGSDLYLVRADGTDLKRVVRNAAWPDWRPSVTQ